MSAGDFKDCTQARMRMSLTYSPTCERCGKPPCTLNPAHEARHQDAIRRKYGLDENNRPRRTYWGHGR